MPEPAAIHAKPAVELADRVLLPGDPQRALAIAQSLLEGPRMFNHNRGLWGYTGTAPDGQPLTVQATGMGGPSAALVVEELVDLGARTLVRVGTCGALVPDLGFGELLVASAVLSADGTSAALGATGHVHPDERLTAGLVEAARRRADARAAVIVSTDLFYDDRPGLAREWVAQGAVAVEMEAATIVRIAERRGVAAGCLLAVTDVLAGGDSRHGRTRLHRGGIEEAGLRAGAVAVDALMDATATDGPAAGRPGTARS